MPIKLTFIGFQEYPGHEPLELWNVYGADPKICPDGSTRVISILKVLEGEKNEQV